MNISKIQLLNYNLDFPSVKGQLFSDQAFTRKERSGLLDFTKALIQRSGRLNLMEHLGDMPGPKDSLAELPDLV